MAVLPPDPVFVLRSQDNCSISSICFHENERLLSGTTKGMAHLWNLQTNRACLSFEIGSVPITSLHHTAEHMYSQEKGGSFKKWSMINTGYVLDQKHEANHMAFCKSDLWESRETIAIPMSDNGITLIDLKTFNKKDNLIPIDNLGFVSAIKCFSINGQDYLLAGYESGHILTWDLRTQKILSQLKINEMIISLDYEPFTNRGICGGPENIIYAISYQRDTMELKLSSEIPIKNPGIGVVKIRNDQKVFVSGGSDARIRIFSWKSLRPLAVLTEHKTGAITDIAFTTKRVTMWNSPIMAASGTDGCISLWDLYN